MSNVRDIVFYSIVTAILCGMLWSLGDVPWPPLILIGMILVSMIIIQSLRERGKGGPETDWYMEDGDDGTEL